MNSTNKPTTTNAEQRHAMALLLDYLRKKKNFSAGDIARQSGIPAIATEAGVEDGKHVQNFIARNGSKTYADKILDYLREASSPGGPLFDQSIVVDSLVQLMNEEKSPTKFNPHQKEKELFDLVLNNIMESGDDWPKKISENHVGVWFVLRHSAYPFIEGTNTSTKAYLENPHMVYAAMEISNPEIYYPRFNIKYKPQKDTSSTPPRNVLGNIISLAGGEYMNFIGHEDSTGFPVTIFSDRDKSPEVNFFRGFVTRKHEEGTFISGYVAFCKSRYESMAELLADKKFGKIGLKTKSELFKLMESEVESIEELYAKIVNIGGTEGECMMRL